MASDNDRILRDVGAYYSGRIVEHGISPRGVDWNGEESQYLRFEQLSKVIDRPGGFSIADLGCGYGALYDCLVQKFSDFAYEGYDISQAMIDAARARLADKPMCRLHLSNSPAVADYAVASGLFNVRLEHSDAEWLDYILATLQQLDAAGARGFAFNCLTRYSDADKMRDYLYYADPLVLFDHCKRMFSRNVALLHDYGLYEFTILVRKQQ